MPDFLQLIFDQLFVGPLWPASILVCLLIIYTSFALIGLIDLDVDVPEADLDLDVGADAAADLDAEGVDFDLLHGIGAATTRWTNFGRVPMVIWGGLFTLAFWVVSYALWHGFDSARYEATWIASTLLTTRNFVIATGFTKAITQPMIKHFVSAPPYDQSRLVGATCEIVSLEASPDFGQAKFRTDAAPLLLNVRTDGPHIGKGTEVRIVDFDKTKRIYKVTHLPSETQS